MKILVGYDGSNSAMDAVKLAVIHARAFDAQVLAVNSKRGGKETSPKEIKAAEDQLAYIESFLADKEISHKTHLLVRGLDPGEDIVRFASENFVEEIVIGIKRRSKVGKLLFGSNAQYIILNANCPVVTIR